MSSVKYSLVIPCFNEAKNLPSLISRCQSIDSSHSIEIIIVDNGSTDNTQLVLRDLLSSCPVCRSVHVPLNRGYGFGILSGLRAAKGDVLGWTHADLQTDPVDFLDGLKLVDKYGQNIFVKGRRYGRPLKDSLFTIGMSFFEMVLLRTFMWDINAQPTIFPRQFFETWSSPPDDFSLDLYAYYQAKSSSLKIYRFPVRFGNRLFGHSHWNINLSSKIKFIRRTIDYSFKLKRNLGS